MILMRLFVAIAPSAVALDELEAATMPLRDDWPQLRPLVSRPMRRACERKLGLRLPTVVKP